MLGRTLGIDVGSQSIKVVELRQTLRGIELVRVQSIPVPPPAPPDAPHAPHAPDAPAAIAGPAAAAGPHDSAAAPEPASGGEPAAAPAPFPPEVATALREWAAGESLTGPRIVCAIPGDRVARRRMVLPFRDRKRIAQAVPFEVESETPFDLDDVFVDWELVGGSGASAEVVATVVPRAEVSLRLSALRDAGIAPRVLEVEGLALANLAEWIELPGTRLLLDLGHRQTTLCLTVGGAPRYARTLPIGGRHLTEALAADLGVPLDEAERRKQRDGVIGGASPAAARVLERLARDLVRTLGGLEPVLGASADKAIDGIVLLGGGARLQRLDTWLAERTGIPAARLAVAPGTPAGALLAAGDPLRLGPALALALRGTLKARTRTNLMQKEFAPRLDLGRWSRELRPTAFWAGLALLLAIVAGANQIALESRRAGQLEAELAGIWQQAAPGRPVPADVSRALLDTLRQTQQRAELLGIYGGNLSALDLLGEISKLVPANLAVIFEELSIDGQVVRIRGHTDSFAAVDQLKAALAGFPHFSDIRVSEIQADATRGGNNFSVTISLAKAGGAPP
ncbi:MAG: type II secretion system protein GspL [Deltaproteobacteria bacterium]|nr:type II secretion system protein GspL [Deltaproteobacteria bacterium]